jgi:diacylglycerol kinase (ATP)
MSAPSESPRSYAVILNPTAGGRRAGREREHLRAVLAAAGAHFEIITTRRPLHATELALEACSAFDAVVAAGGDGTIQEVACGMLQSDRDVPLGIVPLGTGNDLADAVGVPRRPAEAVNALLDARIVRADVGRARWREAKGGRWHETVFINAVGMGFDALAASEAARFKLFRGKSAYLAGIVSALIKWPQPTVTVERLGPSERILPDGSTEPTDGGDLLHRGELFLASVGNGKSVGGGFRLTPYASVADGLFDFCFVAKVWKPRLAVLIPQVIRGTHIGAPEIVSERLPGIRVTSEERGLPLHFDGEVLTRHAVEVEVRIEKGALGLLCPKNASDTVTAV